MSGKIIFTLLKKDLKGCLTNKLLVCLLMTLLDAAAVFFITGGDMKDFPVYTGAVLLASAGLCFLGALAGLLARDQASAGTIGAPLMLLTMLPPLFGGLNETLEKVSVAVPTTSFQTIYNGVTQDQELLAKNNLIALGVCALWIGAGYILFNLFYQRKGIDC